MQGFGLDIEILLIVKRVVCLHRIGYADRISELNRNPVTLAAFLGIDDDDTVGSTRTVDGSRRSILEDVYRLYLIRRQALERVDRLGVIHELGYTVNHIQRGIVRYSRVEIRIRGSYTPDVDIGHCSRSS